MEIQKLYVTVVQNVNINVRWTFNIQSGGGMVDANQVNPKDSLATAIGVGDMDLIV